MFLMRIREVVRAIVEAMLPRFSDEKTGLVMTFDIKLFRNSIWDKAVNLRTAHLLFWRPNNYTRVYWSVNPVADLSSQYDKNREWKLTCDHDSEWISDGVDYEFDRLFRRLVEEVPGNISDFEAMLHFRQEPKIVQFKEFTRDQKKRTARIEFQPEPRVQ